MLSLVRFFHWKARNEQILDLFTKMHRVWRGSFSERLARNKYSTLSQTFVYYGCLKFCNIRPRESKWIDLNMAGSLVKHTPGIWTTFLLWDQDLPHVRWKIDAASISGYHVALELFLLVRPELFTAGEDANLVVERLGGQPLLVGRLRHGRHRVHLRVGDVLKTILLLEN